MDTHEEYKTSDIVLAASLRVKGFPMDRIDIHGNKGEFVFSRIPQEVLDDFDLGKHSVEPVTFHNVIRQLATSVRRKSS